MAIGASATAGVLHALLASRDPGHHGPQLCADLLDLELLRVVAVAVEVRPAVVVLGDPLPGELTALDLVENLAHLLLGVRRDHTRTARVVAVLRGVGDRVVHRTDAALVDEV